MNIPKKLISFNKNNQRFNYQHSREIYYILFIFIKKMHTISLIASNADILHNFLDINFPKSILSPFRLLVATFATIFYDKPSSFSLPTFMSTHNEHTFTFAYIHTCSMRRLTNTKASGALHNRM